MYGLHLDILDYNLNCMLDWQDVTFLPVLDNCVDVLCVQATAVHDGIRQIPTSNELVNCLHLLMLSIDRKQEIVCVV